MFSFCSVMEAHLVMPAAQRSMSNRVRVLVSPALLNLELAITSVSSSAKSQIAFEILT